jgi:hypothetical protein
MAGQYRHGRVPLYPSARYMLGTKHNPTYQTCVDSQCCQQLVTSLRKVLYKSKATTEPYCVCHKQWAQSPTKDYTLHHHRSDFFGYQGERSLAGWPHTTLLGNPNSREPEVLPHQQNTPHAL